MGVGRLICKRSLSLLAGNGNGNGSRRMSSSSRVSPCLVLQPQLLKNDMMYKFYSLEKQKVVNWNKRGGGGEEPADVSKIVGSSHGWLALFNESNNELFLSDPLNRKHIRLPSINTLPDPEINLIQGRGRVSKVILSCSPDADGEGQECRALMSYGAGDRLAFCSPLSGTPHWHWLPVGDLLIESSFSDVILQGRAWQDFVYCSRRKVFSCMTPSLKIVVGDIIGDVYNDYHKHQCEWHELDLSPRWVRAEVLPRFFFNDDNEPMPRWIQELDNWPIQTSHLVYAEETDKLYALVRLIDGSPPPYNRIFDNPHSINDPYVISKYGQDFQCKTVGFLALRFDDDDEEGLLLSMPNSLDGLAMFVGVNHSFAISASKYPELNLKPNSIYFTDVGSRINVPGWSGDEYGGVDAGIFDYQNNVIMPWFDESSHTVPHAPLWYTPNIDFDLD